MTTEPLIAGRQRGAALHAGRRATHRRRARARAPRDPGDRVAGARAVHRRDPRLEARAQRRRARAQLPDAGDLPRRRRHHRRLAGARAEGRGHRGRRDRDGRRALHGRDGEDPQPGQDGADARPRGRLLAGGLDHRPPTCGCCASATRMPRSSPTSTPRPRSRPSRTSAARRRTPSRWSSRSACRA